MYLRLNSVSASRNSTAITMLYFCLRPSVGAVLEITSLLYEHYLKGTIRGPFCNLTVVYPSEFLLLSHFCWVLPQDKTMAYLDHRSERNLDLDHAIERLRIRLRQVAFRLNHGASAAKKKYCKRCQVNFSGTMCPAAHPNFDYTRRQAGAAEATDKLSQRIQEHTAAAAAAIRIQAAYRGSR